MGIAKAPQLWDHRQWGKIYGSQSSRREQRKLRIGKRKTGVKIERERTSEAKGTLPDGKDFLLLSFLAGVGAGGKEHRRSSEGRLLGYRTLLSPRGGRRDSAMYRDMARTGFVTPHAHGRNLFTVNL